MKKIHIMGFVSFLVLVLFPFIFKDSMKGTDHEKVLATSITIILLLGFGTFVVTERKEEKKKVMLDTMSWLSAILMTVFICMYFVNIKEKSFYITFLLSALSVFILIFVLKTIIRKIFKKPPK